MNILQNYDSLGNKIQIGSPVCGISAGNFIYGHILEMDEKKVTMTSDIGYRTNKINFLPKEMYKISYKNIYLLE